MNDEMLCAKQFEAETGKKPSYQYEDDNNPGRYNTKIRDSYVEWLEKLAAVTLRNMTPNSTTTQTGSRSA